MTANIQSLFENQSPAQILTGLMEEIEQALDIIKTKHGQSAAYNPYYNQLLKWRQQTEAARTAGQSFKNHSLFAKLEADIDRLSELDPEIDSYIIKVNKKPRAFKSARLEYGFIKEQTPEPGTITRNQIAEPPTGHLTDAAILSIKAKFPQKIKI
jgi:hypothetical protein